MSATALNQAFLDAVADGVLVTDERGVIEQVNARAQALFGCSAAQLVGRPLELLVAPGRRRERVRARRELVARTTSRELSEALSVSAQRSDGGELPIDLTLARVETEDGVRVIATLRDMSDQRRAQEALRDSSRLLEACFKHMLTQVVILDPDFNFIRVNEAYARATGYEVSDFPGKNHFELFPSDAKAIFERVVATREPFQTFARPFVHPTHPEWGVTYWDWTLVPILDEDSGEVELLVFGLEDVTTRVRTAEELRIREKQLAEAKQSEVVGQLAAGIAHDFNNVLTSVLFTLHLLEPEPGSDPSMEDILRETLEVVQRAKTLTYQLLSFGRRQLLRPEIIELNAAVLERRSSLRHLLAKNTQLRIVTGEVGLGFVKVDPAQLDRVLLNLVTNAADAMPDGGTLTIVTTPIDIDATSASEHPGLAPGSYMMLRVRDEGVGMDEATCERVFEPFFTTKADKRGAGLGLASVLGIVKQSGGEIFVHSEPGAGTTFKILFPRVSEACSGDEDRSTLPSLDEPRVERSTSMSILVVEDEAVIRKLIVEGLRRFGHLVHDVASGEAALVFLEEHAAEVSVVLTDVMMSGIDGVTLANQIEQTYPRIRVALMSGYAETDEQPASRPFIPKPFSPRDIAACLDELFAERSGGGREDP